MPLLSVDVKLVYLVLIINYVHIPAVLEYIVLELNELLGLPHAGAFRHPLDLLRVGVDHETLGG